MEDMCVIFGYSVVVAGANPASFGIMRLGHFSEAHAQPNHLRSTFSRMTRPSKENSARHASMSLNIRKHEVEERVSRLPARNSRSTWNRDVMERCRSILSRHPPQGHHLCVEPGHTRDTALSLSLSSVFFPCPPFLILLTKRSPPRAEGKDRSPSRYSGSFGSKVST
jgi:hypothetical protein